MNQKKIIYNTIKHLIITLKNNNNANIVFAIVEDPIVEKTTIQCIKDNLRDEYDFYYFDYLTTNSLSLPRFCREVSKDKPICVFGIGLDDLKEKNYKLFEIAIAYLNNHRENITLTKSSVVIWCSPRIYVDLCGMAPDFTDWQTATVKFPISISVSEEIKVHEDKLETIKKYLLSDCIEKDMADELKKQSCSIQRHLKALNELQKKSESEDSRDLLINQGKNNLMNDIDCIRIAINLARLGEGFTSPNPMVGAVVVKDGVIVGRGWHRKVGGPHAEVNALQDAGDKAKGATIYVSLEPCNHTGRTPPCTQLILKSGISRVVSAMKDPNPDVAGGGLKYLQENGLEVSCGICEAEAKKLNQAFIKYITTKLPFVTLKCASTLDGRIATKTGDSKWITNESSRRFVHKIRHASDAIMVGIGTVMQDNPSLTTRLDDINGVDPTRIILDTNLSISPDAKVLHLNSEAKTIVVTGESISDEKKSIIRDTGAEIISISLKNSRIDLKHLMQHLGSIGITSLLIEGGSTVIASALKAGIADKVLFFFAPKILGGDDGVPICSGIGPELMADAIPLKNINIHRFEDDIMIEGYFIP
ncbi:diaminohydroxyphosphoribosylaminopyrimidine deaminase / 5-amino-6-(5-phosphoribosylamino)uracil reductase [Candidatus Magnetomoraceae bacterium gMMP-15]